MRLNPVGIAFLGIGGVLSIALWTPIPIYCFVGFSLLGTMIHEWKHLPK